MIALLANAAIASSFNSARADDAEEEAGPIREKRPDAADRNDLSRRSDASDDEPSTPWIEFVMSIGAGATTPTLASTEYSLGDKENGSPLTVFFATELLLRRFLGVRAGAFSDEHSIRQDGSLEPIGSMRSYTAYAGPSLYLLTGRGSGSRRIDGGVRLSGLVARSRFKYDLETANVAPVSSGLWLNGAGASAGFIIATESAIASIFDLRAIAFNRDEINQDDPLAPKAQLSVTLFDLGIAL